MSCMIRRLYSASTTGRISGAHCANISLRAPKVGICQSRGDSDMHGDDDIYVCCGHLLRTMFEYVSRYAV